MTPIVPESKAYPLSGYIIDILGSAVVGIIAILLMSNLRVIERGNGAIGTIGVTGSNSSVY